MKSPQGQVSSKMSLNKSCATKDKRAIRLSVSAPLRDQKTKEIHVKISAPLRSLREKILLQ